MREAIATLLEDADAVKFDLERLADAVVGNPEVERKVIQLSKNVGRLAKDAHDVGEALETEKLSG
jgi:hypothetical protein